MTVSNLTNTRWFFKYYNFPAISENFELTYNLNIIYHDSDNNEYTVNEFKYSGSIYTDEYGTTKSFSYRIGNLLFSFGYWQGQSTNVRWFDWSFNGTIISNPSNNLRYIRIIDGDDVENTDALALFNTYATEIRTFTSSISPQSSGTITENLIQSESTSNSNSWEWRKYDQGAASPVLADYSDDITPLATNIYADSSISKSMKIADHYTARCTTWIYLSSAQTKSITVTTDDGGNWYLDGEHIVASPTGRATASTWNFHKGWNKVQCVYTEVEGADGWTTNPKLSSFAEVMCASLTPTIIELTAKGDATHTFEKYTIDSVDITTNPYQFSPCGQEVVGTFVVGKRVTCNIAPVSSGTITGAGIKTVGDTVTLTATPAAGSTYRFRRYADEDNETVTTASTYSFVMPAEDIELTAKFIKDDWEQNDFVYTISSNILSSDGKTLDKIAETQAILINAINTQISDANKYILNLTTGSYIYYVDCSAAASSTIIIDDSNVSTLGNTMECKVIVKKSNSTSYSVTFGLPTGSTETIPINNSQTATGTYIYRLIKVGTQWIVNLEQSSTTQIVIPTNA